MTSVPFRRTGWHLAAAVGVVIVLGCVVDYRNVAAQSASTSPSAPSSPVVDRVARIDQFLQQYVDGSQVAGIVALVIQDGQLVYEKAVGWRDKEAGDPMRLDSIFRIASQSKAITSAAIMMLVEEGKIRLADPASRFIPAFATTTVAERPGAGTEISIVPARRQIQIKDLLTHTSGMSYGTEAHIAKFY